MNTAASSCYTIGYHQARRESVLVEVVGSLVCWLLLITMVGGGVAGPRGGE